MNIGIINANKTKVHKKNRTAVNLRNMFIIENYLNAYGIYDIYDIKKYMNINFDIFIFGFGSQNNDFNETVKLLNANPNAKIFWLVGDYEQTNYWAILKAKRKFNVITNFIGLGRITSKRNILKNYCLNFNLLIAKKPNKTINKKYDCIYYSRWRPNRAKYLKEYLQNDIYFSSDLKNFKQHKHIGCNPKYIKKLNWTHKQETLNLFKYSLYIEDEYTHTNFNNLANRWYEAGFCNNVMFFDKNCINTIRKSEINIYENEIKDYIVSDYNDLQKKIKECNKDFGKHLSIQKNWRKNELELRENMLLELKNIITFDV